MTRHQERRSDLEQLLLGEVMSSNGSPGLRDRLHRASHLFGWPVTDQVVSSGTNFCAAIIAARAPGWSRFIFGIEIDEKNI